MSNVLRCASDGGSISTSCPDRIAARRFGRVRYSDRLRPSSPAALRPMRLLRIPEPFDHPDWLYEVKFDGFRARARERPPLSVWIA